MILKSCHPRLGRQCNISENFKFYVLFLKNIKEIIFTIKAKAVSDVTLLVFNFTPRQNTKLPTNTIKKNNSLYPLGRRPRWTAMYASERDALLSVTRDNSDHVHFRPDGDRGGWECRRHAWEQRHSFDPADAENLAAANALYTPAAAAQKEGCFGGDTRKWRRGMAPWMCSRCSRARRSCTNPRWSSTPPPSMLQAALPLRQLQEHVLEQLSCTTIMEIPWPY
jgi:hypothetical protein